MSQHWKDLTGECRDGQLVREIRTETRPHARKGEVVRHVQFGKEVCTVFERFSSQPGERR